MQLYSTMSKPTAELTWDRWNRWVFLPRWSFKEAPLISSDHGHLRASKSWSPMKVKIWDPLFKNSLTWQQQSIKPSAGPSEEGPLWAHIGCTPRSLPWKRATVGATKWLGALDVKSCDSHHPDSMSQRESQHQTILKGVDQNGENVWLYFATYQKRGFNSPPS